MANTCIWSASALVAESNFHFIFTARYRRDVSRGRRGEEGLPGELRTDVLRALDNVGGVRVRAGPHTPLRQPLQELLRPIHGPEVQGRVRSQDQARAVAEGEGQIGATRSGATATSTTMTGYNLISSSSAHFLKRLASNHSGMFPIILCSPLRGALLIQVTRIASCRSPRR